MYSERGQRPLPELRPYPGQAEAALRLVHLRRRRSAALAASAAGVAVLASLLVTVRGSGLAVVEPADTFPLPTVTSSASPAVVAPAAPLPAASSRPSPLAVAPPQAGPRVPGGVHATAPAPASPAPAPVAEGRRRDPVRRGLMRKPTACAAPIGAWCASMVPTDSADGLWLQLLACHPAGTGPGTLSFEYEREVDFAILDAEGEELWRWSSIEPEPPEKAHSISAESGWCYVWTVIWNGVADDGRPVPPGEYVAVGEVLSQPPLYDKTDFTHQ